MTNYWEKVFTGNNGYYMDLDNPSRTIITNYIGDNDSVLDLGCGGGALRALLHNRANYQANRYKYCGLDYSETAIKLAKERFPDSHWLVADTRTYLPTLADNTYDVVVMRHFLENCENWQETVRQAFRVANKKVIIVMRRPFISERSRILENPDDTWVWDINYNEFNMLARGLTVNVSYGKVNDEEVVIIGKHLDHAVVTLDDFNDTNTNLPLLLDLKERFPEFKAILFCIVGKSTLPFLREIKEKYGTWLKLGLHGYHHDTEHGTARETDFWTYEQTIEYLKDCESWGVFEKIFRAPGWNFNVENYRALRDRGYIAADHLGHDRWEDSILMPRYTTGHLMEVHGHIQNVNMNGLEELASTKCNFGPHTKFHFIDEPGIISPEHYLPNRYQ